MFCPTIESPVPVLSVLFRSLTVLEPTIGEGGSTVNPSAGSTALSRPNSPAVFGLYGMDAASLLESATFCASTSSAGGGDGFEGPLSVLREAVFDDAVV